MEAESLQSAVRGAYGVLRVPAQAGTSKITATASVLLQSHSMKQLKIVVEALLQQTVVCVVTPVRGRSQPAHWPALLQSQAARTSRAQQAEMMEASQWQSTKRRKGNHHAAPCLNQEPDSLAGETAAVDAEAPPQQCRARANPTPAAASIPVPVLACTGQIGERPSLL